VFIDTNGNVGIGTTGPGAKLELAGNFLFTKEAARTLTIDRTTTAATGGYGLTISPSGAVSGGTNLAGGNLTLTSGISTGNAASDIIFQTSGGGSSGTADKALATVMTIKGSGNVGIGTTGPSEKLDINGSVKVTGNSALSGSQLLLYNDDTVGPSLISHTDSSGKSTGNYYASRWVASAEGQSFQTSPQTAVGTTRTWTTRFMIQSPVYTAGDVGIGGAITNNSTLAGASVVIKSGNVGIGTTSPTNLLSITGQSAKTIWSERMTTAATAGQNLTLRVGGAVVGGTNLNGGSLILAGGISTGTGTSDVQIQTCPAGGSGTSDNTLTTIIQATGSALGFFGHAVAVQQTYTAVSDPPTQAQVTAIRDALINLGLMAAS
jgi:hypothetical protein